MKKEEAPVSGGQIDITGRLNPSTTKTVRQPEFREKVEAGRRAKGLYSTFELNPQAIFDTAGEDNLNMLTTIQRQVLDLRFRQGLSQAQTAESLGRKPRAVSKIERYALGKLQGEQARFKADAKLREHTVVLSKAPFLTDLERDVLRLFYYEDLRLTEVAYALDHDIRRVYEIKRSAVNKIARLYDFNK